jgi:dTDP-4-amino-4,6-dideoxygalactose transaminase
MDRAALYTELFKGSSAATPKIKEGNTHVFHQYCIRVKNRDCLVKHLEQQGIASAIYYPVPLHLQEAYRSPKEKPGRFPVTEETAKDIMALPMYPELKESVIQDIVRTVLEFLG